uniref:MULE transposase domain-containing protein n=1 Tax=Rhizophagus irregularis (strain DAOM 181602 / DAOM 197198 / MUCL 43194) TaxID=747089 RepID=U9UGH7_RHIID
MSSSQQELYKRFSDIVLNDNTCKTNKYNMYLSVFMIKDNYGRFRNVANALIEDELSSTYTWILQCLVKATDNIIPKSFWTDSEPGLINAVAQVFPNTSHFYSFYACRNALCIEIFEQSYMPFQFNGGIQSTQSVESFNGIIKRSLNSTSTLCEVEEAINKRYEEEIRYCQLTDLKAKYTTVGLPHLLNFFQMLIQLLLNF